MFTLPDASAIVEGSIRLVMGETPDQGRLEIAHDGLWGTVCDDAFDIVDANVACRQLGYDQAVQIFGISRFGAGKTTVILVLILITWMSNILTTGQHFHFPQHFEIQIIITIFGISIKYTFK